jgi:hypothetical protein
MWGRGESTFVDINDVAEGDVRLAVGLARGIIDLSGVGVLAWRSFLVEGGGVLLFRLLARERVPVTGPMGQGLVGGGKRKKKLKARKQEGGGKKSEITLN